MTKHGLGCAEQFLLSMQEQCCYLHVAFWAQWIYLEMHKIIGFDLTDPNSCNSFLSKSMPFAIELICIIKLVAISGGYT